MTPKLNNSRALPDNEKKLIHPFEPIIDNNSQMLILGSFPSKKSFENSFYYSHPQNQFWRLLSEIFGEKEPKSIEEKLVFLKKHKIALWDMVKKCKRDNSLDSSLKEIEVNDIGSLLIKYPNIKKIYFTGRKTQKLFEKNFSYLKIKTYYLPSPSPAYKKLTFHQKLNIWKKLIKT